MNIEYNEANRSIWVNIAKINAPIVKTILNSYFEKIKIIKIMSRKLNHAGITIKEGINPIKTTFLKNQKKLT